MVSWLEWHYCACDDPTTQGPGASQALVINAHKPPRGANVEHAKLAVLSRPYPQAIAGTPHRYSFDPATGVFHLGYSTERAGRPGLFRSHGHPLSRRNPSTVIFIPHIHYPHGYSVTVNGGAIASRPGARYLRVIACRRALRVSVNVAPPARVGSSHAQCRVAPRRPDK